MSPFFSLEHLGLFMTEAIEWAPGSYWLVRTEEIAKDISALWHICRFVASAKSIVIMARK